LHLQPGPTGGRLGFTALGAATPDQAPYYFHFPDGNASIARSLVRRLIPGAIPGHTAEDIVTAHVDYARLDRGPTEVEVTYGRDKKAFAARGGAVVMACWNMMIPYLVDELPAEQKTAPHYGVKVPLCYTVVAIRNRSAFDRLGVRRISAPGMYHSEISLDSPVSIGDYAFQRAGHVELLATSFETFERNIRDQLARVLGPGGFDPARDIEAITVNRWPHGYAYEYNPLWIPTGPWGSVPAISPAGGSGGSPSPTRTPPRPHTPIRRTARCRSCSLRRRLARRRAQRLGVGDPEIDVALDHRPDPQLGGNRIRLGGPRVVLGLRLALALGLGVRTAWAGVAGGRWLRHPISVLNRDDQCSMPPTLAVLPRDADCSHNGQSTPWGDAGTAHPDRRR
jgi:hypothetical protein